MQTPRLISLETAKTDFFAMRYHELLLRYPTKAGKIHVIASY